MRQLRSAAEPRGLRTPLNTAVRRQLTVENMLLRAAMIFAATAAEQATPGVICHPGLADTDEGRALLASPGVTASGRCGGIVARGPFTALITAIVQPAVA